MATTIFEDEIGTDGEGEATDIESIDQGVITDEIDLEFEVLPLSESTSMVWKYFGFAASSGKFVEPDKKKRFKISAIMHLILYCHNSLLYRTVVFHFKKQFSKFRYYLYYRDSIHYRKHLSNSYRDSEIFTIAQPKSLF